MSTTTQRLYTVEDLEQLPSDFRCELVRGEIREMPPPPGGEHGNTSNRLSFFFNAHIYANDLGEGFTAETGFLIERDPDTVLAPDYAFVAKERLPASIPKGHLALAPDLVLETRSPSDTKRSVAEKMTQWLQAGVRMVLELHLETRVLTVYRPGKQPRELGVDDELDGEDVLPGLKLPVRKLFRDLS